MKKTAINGKTALTMKAEIYAEQTERPVRLFIVEDDRPVVFVDACILSGPPVMRIHPQKHEPCALYCTNNGGMFILFHGFHSAENMIYLHRYIKIPIKVI